MVNGIEHVAVVSKDTAALKDWYMEMYGGRVVYDNGKGTYFLQFADGSMIELLRQQTIKPLTLKNRQVSDTLLFL